MPRNMSFALTEEQFRNQTKTVTRRLGWQSLLPGDIVMGCKKCRGLRPGERLERLGLIRIVSVSRERLNQITDEDVAREGFPGMARIDFMRFFVDEMRPKFGCLQPVTRIEFEYL